jgi:predicted Zn-dependent protease
MQKDGSNPVLLNNLAWLYDQKGDAKAVELAEKALANAPNTPEVMDTAGWILTRRGHPQRGLKLLEQANKAAPKQGDIAYHYAFALHKAGKSQEAARLLERMLEAKIEFSEVENARKLLKQIRG